MRLAILAAGPNAGSGAQGRNSNRYIKALRMREPLKQRQERVRTAREQERRRREEEAWARLEAEEVQLRQQGDDQQQEKLLERQQWRRTGQEEARLRQARVERRRQLTYGTGATHLVPTTDRRRSIELTDRVSDRIDVGDGQAEQYIQQRLRRKVSGFADLVGLASRELVEDGGVASAAEEGSERAHRYQYREMKDELWDF